MEKCNEVGRTGRGKDPGEKNGSVIKNSWCGWRERYITVRDGRRCMKHQGERRRKGKSKKNKEKKKRMKGDLVDEMWKTNQTVCVRCGV